MSKTVKEKKGKRFSKAEFDKIAEFIVDTHRTRKEKRRIREKHWSEIDRQLRLEPDVKSKLTANGQPIAHKTWFPELELPNQSTALEVLTSDIAGMMFPDVGEWFSTKANVSRQFLEEFEAGAAFIVNDELDPPGLITQDNVDDYVQGYMIHGLRQFEHRKTWDLIATDVIKYGNGVGRARTARKPVFLHHAKGTTNNSVRIPLLAPVSIKDTYLDDMEDAMMADGTVLGPAVIFHQFKVLEDVILAAKKGGTDPDREDGGWIPDAIKGLDGDKNGRIEYLEFEGDLIVPVSSGESSFIPNAIVTVIIGSEGKGNKVKTALRVIRFRFRKLPYSSYLNVPYQLEHIGDPYSTSPLMKGMNIQKAASEGLNRFMQAAILNTEPPVQYERDDQFFQSQGGPLIHPGAQMATQGEVKVLQIGDVSALQAGYLALLAQYADVTGINAPRLGAQTVSHTTAFAKDQEIQRGQIRTVDYARSTIHGPMTRWMYMFYEMSREALGNRTETVYIEKYSGFVNVTKKHLPKDVFMQVFGAGGPQASAAEKQGRQQALLAAVQLNQLAVQAGLAQPLNYDAITRQLLKDGGISDVDIFAPGGATQGPEVQGPVEGDQNLNTGPASIQGLTQGILG